MTAVDLTSAKRKTGARKFSAIGLDRATMDRLGRYCKHHNLIINKTASAVLNAYLDEQRWEVNAPR